ncbi:MAG: metal-dependent hydrolase [Myxococcota bacterium]|nr:metal-dependent hydrolase [Myxococcota bacterium]
MFLGHYALGLAAKRVHRGLSLPILLAAPQLLDLLWPLFVLAGIERVEVAPGDTAFTPLRFVSYPWSHSLAMAIVWGLAFAAVARARGVSRRGAWVVGALVVSHWVLDVVSHRPDMPLWPFGRQRLGLALWQSIPLTVVVELSMYAAGVTLYLSATRSRDRTGTWAFAGLIGFLLLAYVGSLVGPPPPSASAVAISALALWLIPLWGSWIETHRQ